MKKMELQKAFNKMKFKTIKNSPAILTNLGIAGVVGASILACVATLKVSKVLEEHQTVLDTIVEAKADDSVVYTDDDAKKDKTITYTKTTLKIAKLYIPAVVLGGLSIAAIVKSHNILNKRNAAVAAALTTVSESFSKYRTAVVDKYGERTDYELRHGIKTEKVTVKDENGKNKKETIDVASGVINPCSDYARYFDQSCDGWNEDSEYNLMFLKAQQQYANDRLVAKGFLYLNDVYEMIGIQGSKAGQVVGWVYSTDKPEGDNYIDFGIYNVMVDGFKDDYANDSISEQRRDFVNGYSNSILLDFNVDGNIWEKM